MYRPATRDDTKNAMAPTMSTSCTSSPMNRRLRAASAIKLVRTAAIVTMLQSRNSRCCRRARALSSVPSAVVPHARARVNITLYFHPYTRTLCKATDPGKPDRVDTLQQVLILLVNTVFCAPEKIATESRAFDSYGTGRPNPVTTSAFLPTRYGPPTYDGFPVLATQFSTPR
jgi:hypothetical protein